MNKYIIIFVITLLFSTHSFAADKLVVLLDWFPNPNHAPLFVAQQKGYFKQQNLDVELIGPADPLDPPKWVAVGKADIAITYEPQFIQQVKQGLPLARLGTLIDRPLECVITLDPSIHSIRDLKNKRIGSSSDNISSILLKTMLHYHGLSLNDVTRINVHYNLLPSLLSHQIDAVSGVMRNFEVIQLENMGKKVTAFYPEKNGVPPYSELIFVVNQKNSHDSRFKRFLSALQKGVVELQKHPESAWQVFSKQHPDLNNELNHRAWLMTIPYFAKNPEKWDHKQSQAFFKFIENGSPI